MAVVAGTCVASGLLLFLQLLEYIGGSEVDGNQTSMGTVHEMAARCSFLSQEPAQSVCNLLCSCPSNTQWNFDALPELSKNGLQEGNDDTAVNLMHCVAHVHQVDTKMRNQPERIEEQMCPGLNSLRLIKFCSWSRAHVAAVRIPFHDPRAVIPFHKHPRSCTLNPLTNLAHSLHLKICVCIKVTFARRITAMIQARLPCVFVTLLLVAHDATEEKARRSGDSISPRE
mmetsp:Transcript_41742/g.87162  ORF Transcript_41742/g.87162 Transcript_41742/m.87162 type:complete len:228 (+) Transcript_41742:728-1411(+)